jgi:hypothetical protein
VKQRKLWLYIKSLFLLSITAAALLKLEINASSILSLAPAYMILSFLCFIIWQISLAYRWQYCIKTVSGQEPAATIGELISVIWLGNLVSISILPSFIGQDSVKLYKWRTVSDNLTHAIQSILISRIAGTIGIFFIGILCIFVLMRSLPQKLDIIRMDPIYMMAASIFFFMMVILVWLFFRRWKGRHHTGLFSGKLSTWRKALIFLDRRLILMGLFSQLLFVASASLVLMSIQSIELRTAAAITGASALGRLLPISFVGITPGEGILAYILLQLQWNSQEITLGAGVLVIFLYITSIIGMITETVKDHSRSNQV